MNLPQYRCHKVVQAAKITDIQPSFTLIFGEVGAKVHVGQDYFAKHEPCIGGYYVRYEDGYESFSPGQAFEIGYTKL